MTNDEKLTLPTPCNYCNGSGKAKSSLTMNEIRCMHCGGTGLRAELKIPIATESAPAAQTASIDTPQFRRMAVEAGYDLPSRAKMDALIAHINAFAAQQREEGRQEGYDEACSVNADWSDRALKEAAKAKSERERAEKAEAAQQRAPGVFVNADELFAAMDGDAAAQQKARIREIFLANGFTIKPGETDLKPYVYAAAQALIADALAQRAAGELTVWEGAMPESNGKSNFTALLHRKGDKGFDMFEDGFTIDRSEYPDRVRYEADRVRYLIGEISERPCITKYDADKHSGYVAPDRAARAVGVVDLNKLKVVYTHTSATGGRQDAVWLDDVRAMLASVHTTEATPVVSAQAPVVAAPVGDGDERALYTCIGKGGEYELIGYSNGAGAKRGEVIAIYSDTREKDIFYHRTQADFDARMQRIDRAALTQQKGN